MEKRLSDLKNGRFFLKIICSLWLIFHLTCIFVLPNGGGFLGRYIQSYLLPYANAIGVNTTWNFYSPDPANTMYFSYTAHYESPTGEELKPSVEEFLPPEQSEIVTDSSKRRLLYAMRYLALNPGSLKVIMAPWICREHEGATRVSIHHVIERIPNLDTVLKKSHESVSGLREKADSENVEFSCTHQEDELSI
jgi:hypothetical protein